MPTAGGAAGPKPVKTEDKATQGFTRTAGGEAGPKKVFTPEPVEVFTRTAGGEARTSEAYDREPTTKTTVKSFVEPEPTFQQEERSSSGFFSPDNAIDFAKTYALENAGEARKQVEEATSDWGNRASSSEGITLDRAVTSDPATKAQSTTTSGSPERVERPVYTERRDPVLDVATQGIRPWRDTLSENTSPFSYSSTPFEQSSANTSVFARATQGIGSRVSNFFNTLRDTVTPSAYEYGGNIAKSAFQGGEQVNRTDFKDSDVVSLFERTDADQVPRTTGAKTRFSDTKVYENEEGVLVPHTEETLKQFPPNARGLVHDYTSSPSLGVLENIPGVTAVKEAGSAIRYGYDNPLGVRGEGYVEINQPNKFEAPTAIYKDAAYLNLKSDDPNETAGGQGLIGRAISNLTGNKSDILGTEFASTELPYSQWSQKMRADYGFPNFQDSLEATANNETSFSNNYLDQYVDKLGNIKKGVTKDKSGQAIGFETQPEVRGGIRDGQWDPNALVAPEGRTEITDPSWKSELPGWISNPSMHEDGSVWGYNYSGGYGNVWKGGEDDAKHMGQEGTWGFTPEKDVTTPTPWGEYGAINKPATVDLSNINEKSTQSTAQEPIGNYIKNENTGETIQLPSASDVTTKQTQSSDLNARQHAQKQGGSWSSGYFRNQSIDSIMQSGYSSSEAQNIRNHIDEGIRLQSQADALDSEIDAAYKQYMDAHSKASAINVTDQNSYADWWSANEARDFYSNKYEELQNRQINLNSNVISHNERLSQYL